MSNEAPTYNKNTVTSAMIKASVVEAVASLESLVESGIEVEDARDMILRTLLCTACSLQATVDAHMGRAFSRDTVIKAFERILAIKPTTFNRNTGAAGPSVLN